MGPSRTEMSAWYVRRQLGAVTIFLNVVDPRGREIRGEVCQFQNFHRRLVGDRAAALRSLRPHPAVFPHDGRVPAEGSLLAVSERGRNTRRSEMSPSRTKTSNHCTISLINR